MSGRYCQASPPSVPAGPADLCAGVRCSGGSSIVTGERRPLRRRGAIRQNSTEMAARGRCGEAPPRERGTVLNGRGGNLSATDCPGFEACGRRRKGCVLKCIPISANLPQARRRATRRAGPSIRPAALTSKCDARIANSTVPPRSGAWPPSRAEKFAPHPSGWPGVSLRRCPVPVRLPYGVVRQNPVVRSTAAEPATGPEPVVAGRRFRPRRSPPRAWSYVLLHLFRSRSEKIQKISLKRVDYGFIAGILLLQ